MRKEPDWKHLLSGPWCPLFGTLSYTYDPPSSITSQCLEIIKEAREIWGASSELLLVETDFPEANEVKYDAVRLRAARAIFCDPEGLLLKAHSHKPYIENERNEAPYDLKLLEVQIEGKFLVLEASNYFGVKPYLREVQSEGKEVPKSIIAWAEATAKEIDWVDPDKDIDGELVQSLIAFAGEKKRSERMQIEVLSMIALAKAWHCLKKLIIHKENEDAVFKNMAEARFILDRAQHWIQVKQKREEKAERREDGKRGGTESGKGKKEKAESTLALWQSAVDNLKNQRSKRNAAKKVADKDENLQNKPDYMRKKIKIPI